MNCWTCEGEFFLFHDMVCTLASVLYSFFSIADGVIVSLSTKIEDIRMTSYHEV